MPAIVSAAPPCAAGAEGIHPEVFFFHRHIHIIGHLRDHQKRGKRGVAALVGVIGRNAHQAMDTVLRLEVAKGVFTLDHQRGAFDAHMVILGNVSNRESEAFAFHPAGVHAHQDLGPIAGFGTALAGAQSDDGIIAVKAPIEEADHLQAIQMAGKTRHRATGFR